MDFTVRMNMHYISFSYYRPADEKKPQLVQSKLTLIDKKIQDKRALTKENKEPKEAKDTKNNSNAKDEKEVKEVIKDKVHINKNVTKNACNVYITSVVFLR